MKKKFNTKINLEDEPEVYEKIVEETLELYVDLKMNNIIFAAVARKERIN